MRSRVARRPSRWRWPLSLALLSLAGCGSGGPAAPAPPGPTAATPAPGTLSTTGPESVAIGGLYTSNWRTIMSTTAEAKDVASGGFYIWSIYGWTHSEYAGWTPPNGWQWVLEARAPSWTGSVDLSKAFAFWRSRGLPNEYVVDLTWALEAGAGAGATSGEVQLTRVVVPPLAR